MSTQVFAVMVERRGSGILYIEAAAAPRPLHGPGF
jgi:hypothetical protein